MARKKGDDAVKGKKAKASRGDEERTKKGKKGKKGKSEEAPRVAKVATEDEKRSDALVGGFSLQVSNKISGDHENISIGEFTIASRKKVLFQDATLHTSIGHKYGIIGKNGIGKSTLLKHIATKKLPISKRMDILYVEQEVAASQLTPVEVILDSNRHRANLWAKLKVAREQEPDDNFDVHGYEAMEAEWSEYGYDSSEYQARKILKGLGFRRDWQDKPIELFSGGWRMRISIAKALFREPTVLMLDEPTNHLDLNAVIWLTWYLSVYPKTVMVVSHNKNFLNEVCTDIINIDNCLANQFSSNYDGFLKTNSQLLAAKEKDWEKLQKKVNAMRKKGTPKKEVIAFVEKSGVQRPPKEYSVQIRFFEAGSLPGCVVDLQNVSFKYGDNVIFKDMKFAVGMQSRMAIVGPNGVGKSTLMRLITGDIEPDSGYVEKNRQCRVGYYSQHFASTLPGDVSAVDYLIRLFEQSDPNMEFGENKEQYIRSLLGAIGLEGSHHKNLIQSLSGGQKARVAFVSLFVTRPHVLLLDEPSNHLDIETLQALIEAINDFKGGVVIISHDIELITKTNCQLYNIEYGTHTCKKYPGEYIDYKNAILKEIEEDD